jgi:two-component system, NtrC family, nitrogen regulation sensor histidine kinase NtrY
LKVLRYAIAAFTLILLSSGLHIFLNDADKVFEKQAAKTQRILSAVEKSFSDFYANESLHLKLANRTFSEPDLQQFEKCNFEVFVYKEGVSTYWSTNEVQINYVLDKVSEIPALFELKNGFYILQKKQFENCDIILAHLIKYNYSIENKFLRNKFHAIYPLSPTVEVTVPDSGSVNLSFFEKPVFGLMPTQGFLAEMAPQNIVAGYTAIFSLFSMLVLLVVLIVKVNGYGVGLVVWLLLFFLIRGLFYLMPSAIYATPIFSPELYASVVFGASLGMFLIQTIWFLVLSIIIYGYFKTRKFKVKNSVLWLLTVGVVVSTVLLAQGLKSIVLDSVISYKINTFTELNNYTLIGLYLIAFAVLGVYILLRTFINVLAQHSNKHLYVGAQAALIVGTLFLLGFSWLSVVFGVSYTVLALLLMYLKSMAREAIFFLAIPCSCVFCIADYCLVYQSIQS